MAQGLQFREETGREGLNNISCCCASLQAPGRDRDNEQRMTKGPKRSGRSGRASERTWTEEAFNFKLVRIWRNMSWRGLRGPQRQTGAEASGKEKHGVGGSWSCLGLTTR